jgi:hypothetical protein
VADFEHTYRVPGKRGVPLLENIRIASPCSEEWDAMDGNGRVRHCAQCDKQVFNLSGMSRADAEVLVRERAGSICVRLYQREDGTVLTTDCPVGVRRRLTARALMSVATTALLGGLALIGIGVKKRMEPVTKGHTTNAAYAERDRPESLTTASMLALQNDARLAEEARLADVARLEAAARVRPPLVERDRVRHTMGVMCPIGRGRHDY